MMGDEIYSRHVEFEEILNFRDLGGYRTGDGRMVAWRRLFRSGELHYMTGNDAVKLKEEIRLSTVIDLRSLSEIEQLGTGMLNEVGIRYFNVSFDVVNDNSIEKRLTSRDFNNTGELYLYRTKNREYCKRIIKAMEIIAGPDNHPLVFHCSAGKDRTGVLSAIVLSVLGVPDEVIIHDYILTALHMEQFTDRWNSNPVTADALKNTPQYHKETSPEAMELFLSTLKQEYGSVRGYIEAQGADAGLFDRLEEALLV